MTVSQEIILHMVQDNTSIKEYEKEGILAYKYFTSDYMYLEFVMNRYYTTGMVTLGELCIRFPDFPTDFTGASQDVSFLCYSIKEQYVFQQLSSAIAQGQDKFPNDGIQLMGYLEDTIHDLRSIVPVTEDYDAIKHARDRYNKYLQVAADPQAFITTGFPEIDQLIGGWSKGGELGVFLARMGMGKTWILIYCCIAAWQRGFKCGFVSIEMGKDDIGYRMDTIISGLSNSDLRRGGAVDMKVYQEYLNMLEGKGGILIRSKKDFGGHITPSGIASWIKTQNLDIVFIDGIGYVENERRNAAYKSEASSITDVSEDLVSVSTDTGCPIIITAQANRGGSDRSVNPQMENVRGSDGIGINATFVASIAYPDDSHKVLSLEPIKVRFGAMGGKFMYDWDPNYGYIRSRGESSSGGAFFGS